MWAVLDGEFSHRTDLAVASGDSSSLAEARMHLFRLSKSLTVAQTLSTGALMSTVSVTRMFSGDQPR